MKSIQENFFIAKNLYDMHLYDEDFRGLKVTHVENTYFIQQDKSIDNIWARLSKKGYNVVQVLEQGQAIGVVVNEKYYPFPIENNDYERFFAMEKKFWGYK